MLAQATPPPTPPEELQALLTHPLLLAFAALLAAWIASRVVHEQVRKMGLEREDDADGFGWTALFSTLSFWAVLTLGLLAIAAQAQQQVVGKFLQTAFDLLLRALLAGGILAAAAAAARTLFAGDPEKAEEHAKERRALLVVGGIVALLAAVGLSLGLWFVLAVVGLFGWFLVRSATFRGRITGAVSDLRAGMYLGGQFKSGDAISGAERSVVVAGKFGAFRTWVREEGQRRLVRNDVLLSLTGETPDVPELPSADPALNDTPDHGGDDDPA